MDAICEGVPASKLKERMITLEERQHKLEQGFETSTWLEAPFGAIPEEAWIRRGCDVWLHELERCASPILEPGSIQGGGPNTSSRK